METTIHIDTTIRKAERNDLPAIVKLLSEDVFGAHREKYENPLPASYQEAFDQIQRDPCHEIVVMEQQGRIIGTLQLSMIPHLSHQGAWRAQIESVTIHTSLRRQGLGSKLVQWAIDRSREKGAKMVQLTSNKARTRAVRFYEKLGFQCSHEGLKLMLN